MLGNSGTWYCLLLRDSPVGTRIQGSLFKLTYPPVYSSYSSSIFLHWKWESEKPHWPICLFSYHLEVELWDQEAGEQITLSLDFFSNLVSPSLVAAQIDASEEEKTMSVKAGRKVVSLWPLHLCFWHRTRGFLPVFSHPVTGRKKKEY